MNKELDPFNIAILVPEEKFLRTTTPVTELSIFENNTRNFDPKGLFSTEIFGRVGTDERMHKFSYLKLNIPIIHPLIFETLGKLKSLYKDILAGKKYAVFDSKLKDFVLSTIDEGETGFTFFMNHFKDIKFEERESVERSFNIKMVYKYKDDSTFKHLMVLPAGLRDYSIDDNGKPSEDEINSIYRKVMNLANFIGTTAKDKNIDSVDHTRYRLQITVYELYLYIKDLIDGKKKFVQAKWSKRKVFSSTRNVITSSPLKVLNKVSEDNVSFNDTVIGLYQFSKAIINITTFEMRTKLLDRIFSQVGTGARLVNKETLKIEDVELDSKFREQWVSIEGIEDTVNKLFQEDIKHTPVTVGNYYLVLVYVSDTEFKVIFNDNDIPDRVDKSLIRPMTYAELIYYSIEDVVDRYPGNFTRYPVSGLGGTYITKYFLRTTMTYIKKKELGEDWEQTGKVLRAYPVLGESFFNSMSPHYTRLKRLGADFDGDKCNTTALVTEESIKENEKLLNSKSNYVAPDGTLTFSVDDNTINSILTYITS